MSAKRDFSVNLNGKIYAVKNEYQAKALQEIFNKLQNDGYEYIAAHYFISASNSFMKAFNVSKIKIAFNKDSLKTIIAKDEE